MAFKTILAHFSDERKATGILSAAASLARKGNGHLIGIFIVPPPVVLADFGMPYDLELAAHGRKRFEEEAARVRKLFDEATQGQSFVAEWRLVYSDHPDANQVLLDHCRSVDVVVAGQSEPDRDVSPLFNAPHRIALESGRPVLIIPYAGRFDVIGERVMVAWNNRREATRAIFDALPLLQTARDVHIMWVNPDKGEAKSSDLPTAEIATTLSRHGVKAVATHSISPEIDVGSEILARLADQGADLLVMGCYGHSRLHEIVFGGATRTILKQMTVPVLMSH